jgi:outer membrane protein insertion porin family
LIKRLIAIAVVLCAAVISQAQDNQGAAPISGSDIWGKTVTDVKIQGVQSADTFLVLNSSGIVIGDQLSPGVVQDAIKGIYALGLFSDVQIDANPSRNGIEVTIQVTEFPKLNKLAITGNKKIKVKKLKESLTLFEGRLVTPESIKSNIEKIKTLYSQKGYLLVDVDVKKTPVEGDSGQVNLDLTIHEGGKVKIETISFTGNRHFSAGKLGKQMSTKEKSLFRGGNFDREKYIDDKDKLIAFYKNHGFIDAVITGDSIWYNANMTRMFIHINLKEGSPYYFGQVTWDGNKIVDNQHIKGAIKFKPGTIYNQKKYDDMLAKLHEIYQDEGYWYANIDEKNIPNADTVNFHLAITENNPVHIRLVNIEGNTKTREKVIRRELTVLPGAVFKRSILGRSLRDLMITNFFANAEPNWDILPNGDIDLKVKVTEKETGQFSVGAGYSQVDKLTGTVGLGIPNIFGTGQTATLDVQFGSTTNNFNLSYLEPWFLDTPTSISGSAYITKQTWYSLYDQHNEGGNLQVGRRLRWPDNYFRIYGEYAIDRLRYSAIADTNYSKLLNKNWLTQSSISLTVVRDSRDLPQFATKGSILTSQTDLSGTFLGGNWNYFKQQFIAEYYKKVFWKAVLMGRARFGAMGGIYHGDKDIPYGQRFSPGGVNSDGVIRGYDDGLVGPYTSDGTFLRGRFDLVYNLELTFPISEQQFYVILFADAGNSYLAKSDVHLFKGYKRSIGPGFRVLIPLVGIMGFDFGYALDSLNGSQKGQWKTHFQIGRGF